MLTFTNPRRQAVVPDYPLGGSKRGPATFQVHAEKRGERVSRTTIGKPKFTTYGDKCAIVDGSDGRTYVLQLSTEYGESVRVIKADLMHDADDALGRSSAYFRPSDPEFPALKALVEGAA